MAVETAPLGPLNRRELWSLVLLLAMAFCIRYALALNGFLGYEPAYSLALSRLPWNEAHWGSILGNNLPLHMLLLKPWVAVSRADAWIFLQPALFGTAAAAAAFIVSRRFFGTQTAWTAAGLTALSPMLVQTTLSPRYETPLALAAWLFTGAVLTFSQPKRCEGLWAFILTGALGMYLFGNWIFLLGAGLLWTGWARRADAAFWKAAAALAVVCACALYCLTLQRGIYQGLINDSQGRGLASAAHRLIELGAGLLGGSFTSWFDPGRGHRTILALMTTGALLLGLPALRNLKKGGAPLAFLLLFTLAGGLASWAFLGLRLVPKYHLTLLPPTILLFSISAVQSGLAGRLGLGALVTAFGLSLAMMGVHIQKPINNRTAAAYIASISEAGEPIYVIPASYEGVLKHYLPGRDIRGVAADHDYFKDSLGTPLGERRLWRFIRALPKEDRALVYFAQGLAPYTDPSGRFHQLMSRERAAVPLLVASEDNFFPPRAWLICYPRQYPIQVFGGMRRHPPFGRYPYPGDTSCPKP